ncbi:MAG: hypothetical protein HFJ73_03095 [Eggerthellaceae bacterium]|jgi:signal transduction histidine kinase|nr:hypothetical protein [Eggerthellaceae bacterium]
MSRFRSKQSRELHRRLTTRLALAWAAYTAAFIVLALVLNVTVVRSIANAVADATAPWHYREYENYTLDECLTVLGYEVVGEAVDPETLDALERSYAEADADAVAAGEVDGSGSSEGSEGSDVIVERFSDQARLDATVFAVKPALVDTGFHKWMTADDIKRDALRKLAAEQVGNGDSVVIEEGPGFVAARDLSTYNAIRALKVPLVLVIYLAGCAIIVRAAMSRSLRSFDELSGAVADLMADRERPIVLPPSLAIAQDELNAIRLAALSDERAAVAAERRKDELVAYLAHDIKTPLTSVVGYLELLDEAPDLPEPTRRRYIKLAFEKASRFGSLIDEFFEITRYNLQAIPLERCTVEPRLFLEQVAEELYPAAEARNVSIAVEVPADEGLYLDPDKMARAISNVLRNAVAYADEGSIIAVEARIEQAAPAALDKEGAKDGGPAEGPGTASASATTPIAAEPPASRWLISVANQGREISAAHLQSIFDKFYREDGARSTNGGGAGLGLAIAKEIVAAHGGTIAASSADGRTVFTIELPRMRREGSAIPPVA